MIKKLTEDKREIRAIVSPDLTHPESIYVGWNGVTKIVAYDEYGLCSYTPWLAVYKGDYVWMRVAAQGWAIYYKEQGDD